MQIIALKKFDNFNLEGFWEQKVFFFVVLPHISLYTIDQRQPNLTSKYKFSYNKTKLSVKLLFPFFALDTHSPTHFYEGSIAPKYGLCKPSWGGKF